MVSLLNCHPHPDCEAVVIAIPPTELGSLSLLGDDQVGHEVAQLSLTSGSKYVIVDLTQQPVIGARFAGLLASLTVTLSEFNRRLLVVGDPLGVLLILGLRDHLHYSESLAEAIRRCESPIAHQGFNNTRQPPAPDTRSPPTCSRPPHISQGRNSHGTC